MVNRTIQLEDIVGVPAANQQGTVIITVPRGPRVKRIILKVGRSDTANNAAVPIATLGEIQLRMGGGIQRRVDATKLDAENANNGAEYASQSFPNAVGASGRRNLPIFFEEPWRTRVTKKSVAMEELGWETGWLPANKPLQIAVVIPALGAGVVPVLTAEAVVDDFDSGAPNAIIKWNTDDFPINGGTLNVTSLANGLKADDRVVSISAYNGTGGGSVNTVRMEVGPVVVKQDQGINELNGELTGYGMSPATANAIANAARIIFDANDALDDTLPTGFASSLIKFGLTAGAAGSLPLVTQIYGMPNRS